MTVEEAVRKYSNMLFKVCIVMLQNEQDAQDAIQDTFCRYMEKRPHFRDEEHEKAWLLRVAGNICRDMLRFRSRHPGISIEELTEGYAAPESEAVLEELLELPAKLRMVIYLHYVEGYKVSEIASITGLSEHAVKKRLQRGREQLKISLKEASGR